MGVWMGCFGSDKAADDARMLAHGAGQAKSLELIGQFKFKEDKEI